MFILLLYDRRTLRDKGSMLPSLHYAAVTGHLELTLLKDRQRFDAISTSNLEVYRFRAW